MASSLKSIAVPPKGTHTATVIFMHVRRHHFQSTPSPDHYFSIGIGRYWQRLEASC